MTTRGTYGTPLSSVRSAAALHEHVAHVLVLLDGPPQGMPFTIDGEEDLVQRPCVARLRTPPSQPMSVVLPTLATPLADGFVGHHDAACSGSVAGGAHGAEPHSCTGVRMGAPLAFSSTTTNLAGAVVLALRPTTCTSVGPS